MVAGSQNSGIGLLEVYEDRSPNNQGEYRVKNISTRGHVEAGTAELIVGFALSGKHQPQKELCSHGIDLGTRVRRGHPLRRG